MAELIGEVGGELFQYNREGWKFGAELRQRDLYQRQKMRIKQVDLYREDIRDLFDLTVGKMDKYVIVCLVMLSITMELFFRGRNPVGTPSWLFWCWAICTAGAMLYLLLAIWLALHASICAQTFSVRCLTQWLRLPIPSPEEIALGATTLEQYEKGGAESLLRVPVLGQASEAANGLAGTSTVPADGHHDLTTDWHLFTSHFNLFNRLHRKWQGYEAYSRVCMCLGLNHFLAAMSYFSLAVYALDLQSPWAGWAFMTIFQGSALLHARLNLNLTFSETIGMIALVTIPSLLLSIAVAITMTSPGIGGIDENKYDLAPCVFACVGILGHIAWIGFFLVQTKSDLNGLPVKFSTVWCIDVLGFGMETLREVQEPVGKPTYTTKLPGYSKEGPKNMFQIGHIDDGVTGADPGIAELVPESEELQYRSQLPWRVFKFGSAFTVVLWIAAFAQTIVIPFGVDTGVSPVSLDVPARRLLEAVNEREIDILEKFSMTSVRGFLVGEDGAMLIANETRIVNTGTGETVECKLPSGSFIQGLSGSAKHPFALLRTTASILDCRTGRVLDSPPDAVVDSVAVTFSTKHNFDIFSLIQGRMHYLVHDTKQPSWVPLPNQVHASQITWYSDSAVAVMDVRNQVVDCYDSLSGNHLSRKELVNEDGAVWTHISGNHIMGYRAANPMRKVLDSFQC